MSKISEAIDMFQAKEGLVKGKEKELYHTAVVSLRYMQREMTDANKSTLRQCSEDDLLKRAEDFLGGTWRVAKKRKGQDE
jgi:hypothetical protein